MEPADVASAVESLERILAAIDRGEVEATALQVAFIAGAIHSLRNTTVYRKLEA